MFHVKISSGVLRRVPYRLKAAIGLHHVSFSRAELSLPIHNLGMLLMVS